MYLQFHLVEEPSKNLDIWVRVLVGSLLGRFCSVLGKPGFWFGSFLLGSDSFPSLAVTFGIVSADSALEVLFC